MSTKKRTRSSTARKSRTPRKPRTQRTARAHIHRMRKEGPVMPLPRTGVLPNRTFTVRRKASGESADEDMTLVELQFMAKSLGIPFGGLNKEKLIKYINSRIK